MATDSDVFKTKSAGAAVALAGLLGSCAGYSIGTRDATQAVDVARFEGRQFGRREGAAGKTYILNRAYYRTEAAYQEAVRQMSSGAH